MGLTSRRHLVYLEELDTAGAPRMNEQGTMNLGPVLIMFGTPEQRARYLPNILSGEHIWCQGYSEPNAGSDLASLRTEGRIDGDRLVLNGQKIWTSMASEANHMFALVRTDKSVRKQAGLTFVMFAMTQPGVTVRPIRKLGGDTEFCEVFLDDVEAPLADVVGGLNNGWTVANGLLGSERLWAGSPRHSVKLLALLRKVARAAGGADDPVFRDRLARLEMDVLDCGALYERNVRQLETGRAFGYEASMLKIWQCETYRRIAELMVEVAGSGGALLGAAASGAAGVDVVHEFYESRLPTIYGGSVEIHRNILAKNVLKLPN
jgi:alkylation response protein AidB-like acyl-CoA dehydrogenase